MPDDPTGELGDEVVGVRDLATDTGRDEGGRPGVGTEVAGLRGDDGVEVRLGGGADHEGHETCLRALGSTASGRRR